jgi:hypothetical protein
MAQEAAEVRMQLDQQALNALPGDERVGLEVTRQSAADYLSNRWSSPASFDPWRACFDATNMAE